MMKIIGIKDLQTKTKQIREEVEKGVHFIVVWRSRPIFELKPIKNLEFSENMAKAGLYKSGFIEPMRKSEDDIKNGSTKRFIWDYNTKNIDLHDPEIMKWYLKRKIDFSDWKSIDRKMLEKYLSDLDIDPSMKKLLSQFLLHEKNSNKKTKRVSHRTAKK
mgnify:CR=1 FL=1